MNNIDNNKESIRKESIRLFKLHCKDMGIKADEETYHEWERKAKEYGFDNLTQYIKYLRGDKDEKEKLKNKNASVDKFNLRKRGKNLFRLFIAFFFFIFVGVIVLRFIPSLSGLIISVILICIGSILGIV